MKRAAAALAALVAGCAVAPPQPPAPAPAPAAVSAAAAPWAAERLLAALTRMLAMDEHALAMEIARTREIAEREESDLARVEAALALSMSATPDDAQVVALVGPVLAIWPPMEPEIRAMAGFLQGMASDRRKLRDGLAAAHAKSRDERREAQTQRLRADAQQERADRLQAKLEALTNLEKSLAKRKHADDPEHRPR